MENSQLAPTGSAAPAGVNQQPPASVGIAAEQARSIAEIQAAMTIAANFPRNEVASRDKIMSACQRPALAQTAIYSYPKGRTSVTGPSIRLAEVLARYWGNLNCGFRELNRKDGLSEVEAFAWDLETNTKFTRQFSVKHWRDTRNGGYAIKEEREIYELIANMAQRRVRACILEIIPGDIVEEAVAQCNKTMTADLQGRDPVEGARNLLAALKKHGVTQQNVEKRMGHRIEAVSAAEVIDLCKVVKSIEDGFSSAADWFEIEDKEENKALENAVLGEGAASSSSPQKAEKDN